MADWQEEKRQKTRALAEEVLSISRDQIAVHLRFLDIALAAMKLVPREDIQTMATDGITIYYEPEWVLRAYEKEPQLVARTYLHLLLHLIFFHSFQYAESDLVEFSRRYCGGGCDPFDGASGGHDQGGCRNETAARHFKKAGTWYYCGAGLQIFQGK